MAFTDWPSVTSNSAEGKSRGEYVVPIGPSTNWTVINSDAKTADNAGSSVLHA